MFDQIFFCVILPFIVGSIPFGYIFTKAFGLGDIRKQGSGNIGATNALRTGNKTVALLTLLGDFFKGYLYLLIVLYFLPPISRPIYLVTAFFLILGHIRSIFLGFKGGKGVATALGTYFALFPGIGLLTTLFWLAFAKFFHISSLAALASFTATSFLMCCLYIVQADLYVFQFQGMQDVIYAFCITIALFITHRQNIKNILMGTENTL